MPWACLFADVAVSSLPSQVSNPADFHFLISAEELSNSVDIKWVHPAGGLRKRNHRPLGRVSNSQPPLAQGRSPLASRDPRECRVRSLVAGSGELGIVAAGKEVEDARGTPHHIDEWGPAGRGSFLLQADDTINLHEGHRKNESRITHLPKEKTAPNK